MKARLVALDIDGTLLNPGVSHQALPDAQITQVIAQLIDAGVIVVLATGRMYPGTAKIAEHLGIVEPLVCQQGAAIHHLNGDVLHRYSLDQEIAHELAEYAEASRWPYAWFDEQRYLVSSHNEASQYFADVSGVAAELHQDPRTSGIVASGVDIVSTPDLANRIHQELDQRYAGRVSFLDFHSVTAAHSAYASKGNAIAKLAQQYDIDRADVLAVGDSVNDVSMLQWAGHGATPSHCDGYARKAADQILDGTGVDGVANLLGEVLRAQ